MQYNKIRLLCLEWEADLQREGMRFEEMIACRSAKGLFFYYKWIVNNGFLPFHYLMLIVLVRICCFWRTIFCKIISEHSIINDIISQQLHNILNSLSKNRNTLAKNPNFLVFSSAHHDSSRSSNNQSAHQYHTQNQQDRNHTHQPQPKMFKIRTFAARSISGRQPKIQGRKLIQDAIQCGREDNEVMIHKAAFAKRRISIQGKEDHHPQYSQRNPREQKYTESVIFKEIQILRRPERRLMNFKSIDFSQFGSLAHRPHIWHNPERLQANLNAEYVMIVSSHFICLDPKKAFKGRQRSYNSQKSIDVAAAPEFSTQTESILRTLCSTQSNTFFQHCKIYFKVSSYSQLVDLREYLQANQLNGFDGIIDIRGKYTETNSFYRLQEIISNSQKLIVLEEESMLKAEIPFIEGSQTFFLTLTGKNHTQTQVNKILNNLKQIQTDGKKQKDHNSHKKNALFAQEQKENCHPNLECKGKQQYYKQTNIIIGSNKKAIKKNLHVSLALKTFQLDLDWFLLFSKAHQAQIAKKIKSSLRQNRNGEKKHLPSASLQRIKRQKTRNPSAENKSFTQLDQKQDVQTIYLQGDFKDKMVKYVKILESQRTIQTKPKEIPRPRERQQEKADDLDELTTNVTSRTKSKTPIQIVGDLLRNNSHIARQISKYMNQAGTLRKILEESETAEDACSSQSMLLQLHTLA